MSDFRRRLTATMRATGLSAAQLGVIRIYDAPSAPSSTSPSLPLAGEELLLKDMHQLAGEVVSFGSVHQEFVAQHSDTAAKALLDRGATLVGASSTSEFGTTAYTEPVGMDEPVNPIHAGMMAGGSSGGAAVAVARGLVNIAHATDGGGSIRIPAACCGLIGLKPAHDHRAAASGGFTPTAQGFIAGDLEATRKAYGLERGTLRRRVTDGALRRRVTDGALRRRVTDGALRLGYTNTPFHSAGEVDPQIAAATAAVASLLVTSEAVGSVGPASSPYDRSKFEVFSEFLALRCADLPGELSPITDWLRARGRQIPRHHHQHLVEQILALDPLTKWDGLDVVVTPTLACAPPAPGTFSSMEPQLNFLAQTAWTPWGTLWNLKGWAAVSVPLVDPARVPGRWPIALMLGAVGDRVSEAELLDLAEYAQEVARQLPAEQLSIAEPGDVRALNFEPRPANKHEHGAGEHGTDEHGHEHGTGEHGEHEYSQQEEHSHE